MQEAPESAAAHLPTPQTSSAAPSAAREGSEPAASRHAQVAAPEASPSVTLTVTGTSTLVGLAQRTGGSASLSAFSADAAQPGVAAGPPEASQGLDVGSVPAANLADPQSCRPTTTASPPVLPPPASVNLQPHAAPSSPAQPRQTNAAVPLEGSQLKWQSSMTSAWGVHVSFLEALFGQVRAGLANVISTRQARMKGAVAVPALGLTAGGSGHLSAELAGGLWCAQVCGCGWDLRMRADMCVACMPAANLELGS